MGSFARTYRAGSTRSDASGSTSTSTPSSRAALLFFFQSVLHEELDHERRARRLRGHGVSGLVVAHFLDVARLVVLQHDGIALVQRSDVHQEICRATREGLLAKTSAAAGVEHEKVRPCS